MKRIVHWKWMMFAAVMAGAFVLPTATASAQIVTVQPGDSLYLIAKRHGLTIDHLKIANRLTSDLLYAGSTLYIPPSSTVYTVKYGDTLWKIAARFGTTIQAIKETNRLNTDVIFAGSRLLVPQTTTASVPSNSHSKPWTEMTVYTVKPGDTPWSISLAHGIPMSEFLQVNGLSQSSQLAIRQRVKIPVHHIPVTSTPSPRHGEYLDWFQAAQYLFPINATATVTDFQTGKTFRIKRTIGAFHADCEPLTAADAAIIKQIWGGSYSWKPRPVIVETKGRRIAASMSSMPHSIDKLPGNHFAGHFDLHFLNSLRHKDSRIDPAHQANVRFAAGR